MKNILFSCGIITLLTTGGCVVAGDGPRDHYHGHARYERRQEVIVGPPEVVVRPPEIIVR